jgi:hypothetical protein
MEIVRGYIYFRYLGAYHSPTWAYAKLPGYYQLVIRVLTSVLGCLERVGI